MDFEQERSESNTSVSDYWTPERRKAAKPRERVVTTPLPTGGAGSSARPGYDPGAPEETQQIEDVRRVPDPTQYPWRTVGKLFFVSGGQDWVGSASVIASNGLMTVAHNLYDARDGWSSRIHFVPAYTDGAAPYGGWQWNKCWIQEEWYRHDTDAYDFGLVRLDPGGNSNQNVGDVVGWLGVRTEIDPRQTWIDTGYPSAFDAGQRMIASRGAFQRRRDDGLVVSKDGWLGKGASGGPWLLDHDPAIANGIHSFSHPDHPHESFSPYFRHWMVDFIDRHFARQLALPRVA